MNKILKIIYSIIFFLVCAAPLVVMPFINNTKQIEKKSLAEKPLLIKNGNLNTNFSEDFESWYNDRIPFRSKLLTCANFINSEFFASPSANVITGKDDWLFYENTVNDYMNTNAMDDSDLNRIVVTLSLLQENVINKGGNFVFVPIPNKNSIYGEYMPSNYIKANENNLTRLQKALDKSDVKYLDMKNVLLSQKKLGLYHKRDTHWNNLGALIGYNAIMDNLKEDYKTYNLSSYKVTNTWCGDLDKLLYPDGGFMDKQFLFDIKYDDFRFTYPVGVVNTKAQLDNFMSDKEENDHQFKTQKLSPTDDTRLFMVRDSFGRALLPFMIDNYNSATFVRTNSPNMSMVGEGTDMIYEIVERNLSSIIETAPFMFAPKRQINIDSENISETNNVFTSQEAYGYKIFGVLDEDFISSDSRVYVKLDNGEDSVIYEAFPIYEKDLLDQKKLKSQNGFSLTLDTSEISPGEYSVSIISGNVSSGEINKIIIKENEK